MIQEIIPFETKWAENDHITLLAMEDDSPVGTCMVDICKHGEDAGKAFLWNLQVEKRSRKKNFGSFLLNIAIGRARDKGCSEIRLVWRSIDSPEWVLRWYERKGFNECSFGKGIVEMRLDLKGGEE